MILKMAKRHRPRSVRCKECRALIKLKAKGIVPTYCGHACRQKAYMKRRLTGPMVLLSQDIATAKVRDIIRDEVRIFLVLAGLLPRSPPPLPPPDKTKRKKPQLRIVRESDD